MRTTQAFLALRGLEWVEIEAAAVEEDGSAEVGAIAEATRSVLNLLDLGVHRFGAGIGTVVAEIVEDPGQVALHRLGHTNHRSQLAMRGPVVPALEELQGPSPRSVAPEPAAASLRTQARPTFRPARLSSWIQRSSAGRRFAGPLIQM